MIEFFQTNLWVLWTLIFIIGLILELTSGDFFFMCFAVAAIPSIVMALIPGVGFVAQVITWMIFAVLFLMFVRPFVLKYVHKKEKNMATNADALIGKEGKVIETIKADDYGYVAIDGDQWKAVSRETGEIIPVGTKVRVVARKSIIVTVEPVDFY